MELDLDTIKRIAHEVITTRSDGIDCGKCVDELDRFADLVLVGKNAAEALPMVQDHLEHCPGCREEFEALYEALCMVD